MNIAHCYFLNNKAARFGGAIRAHSAPVNIAKSRFRENCVGKALGVTLPDHMANGGGAVYSYSRDDSKLLQIINCEFYDNTVESNTTGGAWGGAVAVCGSTCLIGFIPQIDPAEYMESIFDGNEAKGPYSMGGAVFQDMNGKTPVPYSYQSQSGAVRNFVNKYYNNTSDYKGGALYIKHPALPIEQNEFEGNSALYGGAVCVEADDTEIGQCSFTANSVEATGTSAAYGGAVFTNQGSAAIKRCSFEKNHCTYSSATQLAYGGGLFMQYGEVKVVNCYFTQNYAYAGGGLYAWAKENGDFDILNCTITQNKSMGMGTEKLGGGIRCIGDSTGTLTLTNTILYNNFRADETTPDEIRFATAPSISAYHCAVPSNIPNQQYSFSLNPSDALFVDAPTDFYDDVFNLALAPSSPCVDAASTRRGPREDIIGTARPLGSASDIGAYEYDPN